MIGPILVHDVTTHAHCNWSIKPAGTTGEIAEVERLLDQLRVEYPFVTPG
ncbi:hypothetical protein ABS767_12005 [Sphingomonas sp. ST-64]|uniref:Uncharacterized protein n=1 Tax=Sphingomonas plantiphila TaxID=3163295 RepID=A0ABW8YN87_9SPHN